MAELVDALVSNTSGSDAVPVRSRLRVRKKKKLNFRQFLLFFATVKHLCSESEIMPSGALHLFLVFWAIRADSILNKYFKGYRIEASGKDIMGAFVAYQVCMK